MQGVGAALGKDEDGLGLVYFLSYSSSHHSDPSVGSLQEEWLGLGLGSSPCSAADFSKAHGILLPVPAPASLCCFYSALLRNVVYIR